MRCSTAETASQGLVRAITTGQRRIFTKSCLWAGRGKTCGLSGPCDQS